MTTQSTTGLVELKPCPFCGGEASIIGIRDGQQASCKGRPRTPCFAKGPAIFHGPGGWEKCEADAISGWNTRPTDPTIAELVAALEKARGYVEGNHDEGCELDPEFGEDNFGNNRIDDENEDREYPQDAECTCGTDETLLAMETALTKARSAL